jgi:hypothetical protein
MKVMQRSCLIRQQFWTTGRLQNDAGFRPGKLAKKDRLRTVCGILTRDESYGCLYVLWRVALEIIPTSSPVPLSEVEHQIRQRAH